MSFVTRDERTALLEWGVGSLPVPDGSINAGDREQVVGVLRFSDSGATGPLAVYTGRLDIEPGGTALVVDAGSTNAVTLYALYDVLSGQYQENATVTYDLLNATGSPVNGATAIAMPLVAGTAGALLAYRAALSAAVSVSLTIGAKYTVKVTATDTNGNVRVFTQVCTASPG